MLPEERQSRGLVSSARELPVSGFFFLFHGSHTPLSKSVSDLQGHDLEFTSNILLILLLSGQITDVKADLSLKLWVFLLFS